MKRLFQPRTTNPIDSQTVSVKWGRELRNPSWYLIFSHNQSGRRSNSIQVSKQNLISQGLCISSSCENVQLCGKILPDWGFSSFGSRPFGRYSTIVHVHYKHQTPKYPIHSTASATISVIQQLWPNDVAIVASANAFWTKPRRIPPTE